MSESSDKHDSRARKGLALVLNRIQSTKQSAIAADLNLDEATVSKHKNDYLQRSIEIITASGCKVVPGEFVCIEQRELDALEYYRDVGVEAKRRAPRTLVQDFDD